MLDICFHFLASDLASEKKLVFRPNIYQFGGKYQMYEDNSEQRKRKKQEGRKIKRAREIKGN